MIEVRKGRLRLSFGKRHPFPRLAPAADQVEDVEDDGFVTLIPVIGGTTTKGN